MNSTNDIRDIKGMVSVPFEHWGLVIALVVVALLAGLAWWWWKRHQPAPAAEPVVLPTALEVALAALRQLREDNPPVEQFYVRLSDIVRHFLEDRFELHAPERTTEEFLYEVAKDRTLSEAHKEVLSAFLQECDLVKFARHQPDASDRPRAFAAAERFVREADWRGSRSADYAVDVVPQRAPGAAR
jgi:hypothetical protein